MYENHGNCAEMDPYGSVWADIKTGRSPVAQDHFQTPPDPKRGYKTSSKIQKRLKVRAKPAKLAYFPLVGSQECDAEPLADQQLYLPAQMI